MAGISNPDEAIGSDDDEENNTSLDYDNENEDTEELLHDLDEDEKEELIHNMKDASYGALHLPSCIPRQRHFRHGAKLAVLITCQSD